MTAKKKDPRNARIAAIHIAAAQLGMDTKDPNPKSEYRQMLHSVGRQTSTTKMSHQSLGKVLNHLKSRGWKSPNARQRTHPMQATPEGFDRNKTCQAIEYALEEMGKRDAYAAGIVSNLQRGQHIKHSGPMDKLPGELLYNLFVAVKKQQRRHLMNRLFDLLEKNGRSLSWAESIHQLELKGTGKLRNSEPALRHLIDKLSNGENHA